MTTTQPGEVAKIPPGELAARTVRLLGHQAPGRPLVRVIEVGGAPIVVKDFGGLGSWDARWRVRRELGIYALLNALPGVPACLGPIGRLALALEYVDGEQLRPKVATRLPASFFTALSRLVDAVHARGVAHLDLRSQQNVLAGRDGNPWIVDFGTAVRTRLLGPFALAARAVDRGAVLKWKAAYHAEILTPEETVRARRASFLASLWPLQSRTGRPQHR